MKRRFLLWALAAAAAMAAAGPATRGDATFDLSTARISIDNRGRVCEVRFADGKTLPPSGQSAFCLQTAQGELLPQSVTLSGNKLAVAFESGAAAEFAVRPQAGFVVLELTKLSCPHEVQTFRCFCLPVPPDARIAGTLDAAYAGGHALAVTAAEPNVNCVPRPFGSYSQDRAGCRHTFAQSAQAKVGRYAAEFSATADAAAGGWVVHGRQLTVPLDLTGCKALRAWVYGDGQGEALKIQLYDNAGGYRDNYVTIDFTGWRQVVLTDCPINTLRYGHAAVLNFYYNSLPASRNVSCLIDQVEALVQRDGKEQTIVLEDFEARDDPLWSPPTTALTAETYQRHGVQPARLAVIACDEKDFLGTVERMQPAAGIAAPRPGGVWNKRSPWTQRSYFFLTSFRQSQFDQALAIARRGGFDMILLGQESWCKSTGHYEINRDSFPDGLAGLKATADRFRSAGFKFGLHFLGPSIYPPDAYLTPVPDERLVKDAFATLAADIDDKADFIPTAAAPKEFPAEDGGYDGSGAVLQIDHELILYTSPSLKDPPGFSRCHRGYLGTSPAPHPKGARVAHVLKSYGYFLFDMDTTLLNEAADHFARVANAVRADMLYFDGAEKLQGDHWYYNSKLIKTFHDRLAFKDLLIQASSYSHYAWHLVARSASADGQGDIKGYLDERSSWFDSFARDSLPLDIGWYYGYDPTATPDMFEYILGATIGYDSSMSFQVSVDAAGGHPFTGEILDLIRRYERLRLGGRVDPAMRARLRIDKALGGQLTEAQRNALLDKRREFRLLDAPGGQAFQAVRYQPWRQVRSLDGKENVWPVDVGPPSARAGFAIHAEGGPWIAPGPSYTAPDALTLETFDDLGAYLSSPKPGTLAVEPGQGGSVSTGVTQRLESVDKDARAGGRCAVYTAASKAGPGEGWSYLGRQFAAPVDISWHKAIGFWMRGDGHGGSFKLQLRDDRGACDYYVVNDFVGWQYQQLARPAKDPIDYSKLRFLGLYYNNLPAGATVSVGLDDVKALRSLDRRVIQDPCVELDGTRLVWKGSLLEGQYLVCWPGESLKRYAPGLSEPETCSFAAANAPVPDTVLPAGRHTARFTCANVPAMAVRVRVTLQPSERYEIREQQIPSTKSDAVTTNPKSEARNPKQEANDKFETNGKRETARNKLETAEDQQQTGTANGTK